MKVNEELLDDDNVMYQITPKGIAVMSLLQCGLITDMNDPRAEGFWTLFEDGMNKSGYIKDDTQDNESNVMTDRERMLRHNIGLECINTRQKDSMDEERFIHNFNVCHNKKSYDFQGCPDDFECTKDYTFLAVCDEVSDYYPCKECWKNFLRGEKC